MSRSPREVKGDTATSISNPVKQPRKQRPPFSPSTKNSIPIAASTTVEVHRMREFPFEMRGSSTVYGCGPYQLTVNYSFVSISHKSDYFWNKEPRPLQLDTYRCWPKPNFEHGRTESNVANVSFRITHEHTTLTVCDCTAIFRWMGSWKLKAHISWGRGSRLVSLRISGAIHHV
jgi:hypothetical protein